MPLALIMDLSGGDQEASLMVYNRGNGDERLKIGAFPLVNVGNTASKARVCL